MIWAADFSLISSRSDGDASSPKPRYNIFSFPFNALEVFYFDYMACDQVNVLQVGHG